MSSPVDKQSFTGLHLSNEVRDLLEGLVSSDRPGRRASLQMNIFDSLSSTAVQPSSRNSCSMPDLNRLDSSTSRIVLGPSRSCAMPELGRPEFAPIPENFGIEVEAKPNPGTFRITEERERQYKNFELLAREVTLTIDPPHSDVIPGVWLRDTFKAILDRLLPDDVAPQDKIGFTFFNATRLEQRPIGLRLQRRDQFSVDVLLQLLERCVQSNDSFLIAGSLQVKFLHVRVPNGGINDRIDYTSDFKTFCRKKGGIVTINNRDNLCLARALVVASAFAKKDDSHAAASRYQTIKRCRPNRPGEMQTVEAQRLCAQANVNLAVRGGGIEELRLFQNYLVDYCITVFIDRRGKTTMFEGPIGTPDHPRKHIDLIYGDNHFNVITSVTGAFTAKSYCRPCKYADSHTVTRHRCQYKCPACNQLGLCNDPARVKCNRCHRSFYGQTCHDRHFLPAFGNESTCQVLKKCELCLHTYSLAQKKRNHVCGEKLCTVCNEYVPPDHLCYVQPTKLFEAKKPFLFVFFDFECTQETPVPDQPGSFEHIPNLCISEQVCPNCIEIEESDHECTFCGQRKRVFEGDRTVQKFVDYLAEPRPQFKDVIALAHNFKAYDGQFVLKHMMEEKEWEPNVIMNGFKIMSLKFSHIQFIDSLNFLMEGIAKLPKTFNLDKIPKGHFPHFFNTTKNFNYVGSLPPKEMYGCDDMTVEERKKFIDWYNSLPQNYIFDFRRELFTYCSRDVLILRRACLKFREGFLKENAVDPFRQAFTIAGACMKVFRTNFLQKDTISVLPPGGYRLADRQSREALCWLMWEEHTNNIHIQHASNGREKKICGLKVDGYSENNDNKTVWEYHGCWFHGCPLCFKNRDAAIKTARGETMGSRYERTLDRAEHLRRNGFIVKEMWSCQFEILKKSNPAIADFIKTKPEIAVAPIDPREAFFGGRTNATKLYHKAEGDEKICYYDVCSLYPYICKYGTFPIHHPKIHIGDECPQDLTNIEGLVKADILPPDHLYHPVLPARFNGKLCFALCRTCAETSNQDDCHHLDEQRCLHGTWVIAEVKKAIQLGYKIIKFHEVWEYQATTYDPTTNSGGLFAPYINKFLKLKQEASGWPESCTTDQLKKEYIDAYKEKEKIELDPENIKKNPGLRSLSKLCLVSFWGKWGQRDDLPHASFVKSRSDLLSLLTDPGVEVKDILPVSENRMLVIWHDVKDAIGSHPFTNVVIAAFVTAQARLQLYSYLETLGERAIYFDTDSIIFTQRPGQPTIPTGTFLGNLTNELETYGPEAYIDEFVSGGPKNYAYTIQNSTDNIEKHSVCKVRGITLAFNNREKVNFKNLKEMVVDEAPPIVVPIPHKIARAKRGTVVTRPETKTFRVTYTKRRRVGDFDTLPFGTKRPRLSNASKP